MAELTATSLTLLDRARSLDPDAWRWLCDLYGPLVYRWARAGGLQDHDAADVGQEVFRTVSQRLNSFDAKRADATFRGWLWSITRNKLGDFIRRQSARPSERGGSAIAHLPEESVRLASDEQSHSDMFFDSASAVLNRVLQLIQVEFEETTWQAFWRSTVEGQSAPEIGADLGMTAPAVRQAKYRVLRRLRRELNGELSQTRT